MSRLRCERGRLALERPRRPLAAREEAVPLDEVDEVPQLERVIRRAGEVLLLEALDVGGIEEAERADAPLAEHVRDRVAQLGPQPGRQRGLKRRLPPREHLRRYPPAHGGAEDLLAAS